MFSAGRAIGRKDSDLFLFAYARPNDIRKRVKNHVNCEALLFNTKIELFGLHNIICFNNRTMFINYHSPLISNIIVC